MSERRGKLGSITQREVRYPWLVVPACVLCAAALGIGFASEPMTDWLSSFYVQRWFVTGASISLVLVCLAIGIITPRLSILAVGIFAGIGHSLVGNATLMWIDPQPEAPNVHYLSSPGDPRWEPLVVVFFFVALIGFVSAIGYQRVAESHSYAPHFPHVSPLRYVALVLGIFGVPLAAFVALHLAGVEGNLRFAPFVIVLVPAFVLGSLANPPRNQSWSLIPK